MDKVTRILKNFDIDGKNKGASFGFASGLSCSGGNRLISMNPSTGEELGEVLTADNMAVDAVISQSKMAFEKWRRVPAPVRGELVRDLGNALRAVKEPLGELISLEMGKIRQEGLGEVQEMIDICDFATGLSRQLYGMTTHSERQMHRMYEQWHPLGVVGVISAFNFPAAVWAWNAAIAAVCGDTVIWKPSSLSPLVAIAIQKICNAVMEKHQANGLFSLLVGSGATVGARLVADKGVPLISFTGSTLMGRRVNETVASRMGRCILELGGNNAIIVTPNADLDLAIPAIVFGAVGTAGQRCTSTRRVIVHKDIAAEVADRIESAYEQVTIGDPLDDNTLMGPLVSQDAVLEMNYAIETALKEGGELLCGGIQTQGDTGFVKPTVIRMPEQTGIVKSETFAPILYLLEYNDLEEAIFMHNDVPQGLSSAIFSQNLLETEQFLSAVGSDCGIANVNIGTSGAEIGGAFGGEKETGGGRESGSDAWRGYMRRQTTTINWSKELPLAQGISFKI